MNKISLLLLCILTPFILSAQIFVGPDSIYTHPYLPEEEAFDVNPNSALYNIYDEEGNVVEQITKFKDFFSEELINSTKLIYGYNDKGLNDSQHRYSWNPDTQEWFLSSIQTNKFDESDLWTEFRIEDYDTYQALSMVTIFEYANEDGERVRTDRYRGPNDEQLEHYAREFWIHENGQFVQRLEQIFEEGSYSFTNFRKTDYVYENGIITRWISYDWDIPNQDWLPSFESFYEYEGSLLTSTEGNYWDIYLSEWTPYSNTEYFDYQGTVATRILVSYHDGTAWVIGTEIFIELTEGGQTDRITNDFYDTYQMEWISSSYDQYYYSMVSNVTSELFSAELNISPNPSADVFFINNKSKRPIQIQVLNVNGKQMERSTTIFDNHKINAEDYPAGSYFIKVQDLESNTSKTFKVTKI